MSPISEKKEKEEEEKKDTCSGRRRRKRSPFTLAQLDIDTERGEILERNETRKTRRRSRADYWRFQDSALLVCFDFRPISWFVATITNLRSRFPPDFFIFLRTVSIFFLA